MIDLINNEIASFIDSIESVDEDSLNKIRNRYASSITEDLKNGHYTSNICMVLASNLKLNPKELSIFVSLYNCLLIVSGSIDFLNSITTLIPSLYDLSLKHI